MSFELRKTKVILPSFDEDGNMYFALILLRKDLGSLEYSSGFFSPNKYPYLVPRQLLFGLVEQFRYYMANQLGAIDRPSSRREKMRIVLWLSIAIFAISIAFQNLSIAERLYAVSC